MSTEHMLPLAVQNKNILRLTTAQALAGANSVVFCATDTIVGNAIAPSPSLATLPITLFVLGMTAPILPFGVLARTRDRKTTFGLDTGTGMVIGLTAVLTVVLDSFLPFCLAAMLGGVYAAVALSFRFATTDDVAPTRRARALSLVMSSDVATGIIGPILVTGTIHLWLAHTFAVTFLIQALVAVLAAFLLKGVTPAEPTAVSVRGGRPLYEIVRQPGFAITVSSSAVAYMVMNFPMTVAPLSMHMHGLSQQATNLEIQRHVMAVYDPGFFIDRLIQRFGAVRIAVAGLLITAASVAVGLSDLDVYHYWLSLILLDIGWNFGLTDASAKIIDLHRPGEKTQVQSLDDFLVFDVMIMGSFSSGVLLNAFGWNAVLWGSPIPVAVTLLTLLLRPLPPPRAQRLVCRYVDRLLLFSAMHC